MCLAWADARASSQPHFGISSQAEAVAKTTLSGTVLPTDWQLDKESHRVEWDHGFAFVDEREQS